MSNILRIAILEADTPIDIVKTRRGTYGDIFSNLLDKSHAGFSQSNKIPMLEISKWDIVKQQNYPNVNEVDGILISGSIRLVEYVQRAFESKIPIAGICFGHQILARALGGSVGRSPQGWEVSADNISLSPIGASLFQKSSLILHQMHRDAVLTLPPGFQNLGSSPRCDIQGLYMPGRAISLQAHPEFDEFIMQSILKRRHADGIFQDEMYEDGNMRAKLEHDGVLVGSTILKFFLGRDD